MMRKSFFFFLFSFFIGVLPAQEPSPQDFGKMWTFEEPPLERFTEKYDFDADQEWFDETRMASLKFASWCSASFVSPDGLIITNYHCSGMVIGSVEKEGEDLAETGFYATTLEEERKSPGLFVEQLVRVEKITDQLTSMMEQNDGLDKSDALQKLKEAYSQMEDWKDLRLEIVDYYSGSKYSLYGYKRYQDIRLVMVPEMQMGLYGGDPDNFTYPRYSMDFTFWRAYDENGKPLNTSNHYFPFNLNGAEEGEPVFTIGYPASTERYRTVAQLEYDRDYKYAMLKDFYNARYNRMLDQYKENPSKMLQNQLLYFGNSRKVINGIAQGLKNPELFKRKVDMENFIRSKVSSDEEWQTIEHNMDVLKPQAWALQLLGPSRFKGASFQMFHALAKYEDQLMSGANESELNATRKEIRDLAPDLDSDRDRELFEMTLREIIKFVPPGNIKVNDLFNGLNASDYASFLRQGSSLYQVKGLVDLLALSAEKFAQNMDPMLVASRILIEAYQDAYRINREINPEFEALQQNIARKTFEVLGDALSPDATFTIRISDGIVKGYEYNGTEAPFRTTFFGMYDRYYSHVVKGPWDLPEIWMDPSMEFLKTPANFVSTNDIIGGNSGSPIINRKKEIVGLVFDGNIESLPGNFIFDEQYNRTVAVHAGGILAALQYVYKAKRLSMELLGRK